MCKDCGAPLSDFPDAFTRALCALCYVAWKASRA